MLKSLLLLVTLFAGANAATGCQHAGQPCDCNIVQKCCAYDGGTWYTGDAECTECIDMADDAADAGCMVAQHGQGSSFDSSHTRTSCAAIRRGGGTWMDSGCEDCASDDTSICVSPPPSPPQPPAAPRVAPSACKAQTGEALAKTTADSADPVNEPCYSHSSCKLYGHPLYAGYVCCVAKGTCDNQRSNNPKYYQGGCIAPNYARNESYIVPESMGQAHPSIIEGCVKQGECSIPYAEQVMQWTATGSPMNAAPLSDATMAALLAGATESHPNACREIYPLTDEVAANVPVEMKVTSSGAVSDYTPDKLDMVEATVAAKLGVPKANVAATVAAGSVIITIVVHYATEADAAVGITAIAMEMTSTQKAGAFLSSPMNPITVEAIEAPPKVQPWWKKKLDDLSTEAIIGIAVGASVGGLLLIVLSYCLCCRKKAPQGKGMDGV